MRMFISCFRRISPIFKKIVSFNGFLLVVFLFLIISEQRCIKYCLFGVRMVSMGDILFFVVGFIFCAHCFKNGSFNDLRRRVFSFWYVFLPLFLLILLYLLPLFNLGNFSIRSFTLGGLGMFMVLSFLLLTKYREDEIVRSVFWYALITVFMFLLIYFCTCIFRYKPFIYGEATPALHFPFGSPSQAALFGNIVLMLGVGSVLSLGRTKWLYFIIPVMVIAIFQTGSRSCVWLLIFAWISFIILYFIFEKFIQIKKPLKSLHLVISTVLAIILLCVIGGQQSLRSISLLGVPMGALVSGSADSWRGEKWAMFSNQELDDRKMVTALSSKAIVFEATDFMAIVPVAKSVPPTTIFAKVVPSKTMQGSSHNIYLDFLASGGILALGLFVVFLFSLFMPLLRKIWQKRRAKSFPLYLSTGLAFFIIFGGFYSNPFLHLRFIWIFFGLVLAMLSLKSPYLDNID